MKNKKTRGQSIVEWALILPCLLLIVVSILELAPLMTSFMKVEKAAQYGARTAAIHGNTNDDIKDAVAFDMQGMFNPNNLVYIPPYNNPLHDTKAIGYSETYDGKERTYIEIVPGEQNIRINGGWTMVKITYMHPIYTPLLQVILDVGGFLVDNSFPVVRYAIYRIE